MAAALAGAGIVFEGVPEVVELKREVLAAASKCVGPDIIIASTTSTILVDDLSGAVEHPERFLNVHWLNPAYLIPLVEISPGAATDPAVIARVKALLEGIGKVPVVCAATPGFIVPRIQALAMNEAARMVEEGVASAEDIDKAIRYGFGFRYAVLGLLEFIDWGGGDILYYASRYLEGALRQRPLSRARGDLHATCARAASACAPAPAFSIIPASTSTPIARSGLRRWWSCSGILAWRGRRCCSSPSPGG